MFCQGYYAYTGSYYWIVKELAQRGYVVMIFDYPGQGRSEGAVINNAIILPKIYAYLRLGVLIETPIQYMAGNWHIATANAFEYLLNDSSVNHLINDSAIGIIGHSLGAMAATKFTTKEDRIKCMVAFSHTNSLIVDNINIPVQMQAGDADRGYYSIPIQSLSYSKLDTPKELIIIKRGTHEGFANGFGEFCRCPKWQKDVSLNYASGWFDYFLKNDLEAYNKITTGHEDLSRFFKSKYNLGQGDVLLN